MFRSFFKVLELYVIKFLKDAEYKLSQADQKTRLYNIAYQAGYEGSIDEAMSLSRSLTKDVTEEFKAQFKVCKEEQRHTSYEHIEGYESNGEYRLRFYAKSYSVTFLINPNPSGYATFFNIESKLKDNS